jgi:hypothetical protein
MREPKLVGPTCLINACMVHIKFYTLTSFRMEKRKE